LLDNFRKLISNIAPGYLVLLSALPFVIYLFLTVEDYQRAIEFIAPGLLITIMVTVLAYLSSALLGIILAWLSVFQLKEKTVLRYFIFSTALLLASIYFFSQPKLDYSLIGSTDGRVAIIKGIPANIANLLKRGNYAPNAPKMKVLAAKSSEVALDRLESGKVSAAFIPSGNVPKNANILWQIKFLDEQTKNSAMAFAILSILFFLLTFGAWTSKHHPLAIFSELYVDMMRGIPMLVVILYVGFPLNGAIKEATNGFINMSRVTRGVIGISLGYAAYMAEIFRAGIQAIPYGQVEAARSIGLSGWQTARFIILPQALKIVIPPLGNEFIAMLKDTSLLSILSVRDVTQRTREFAAANFQYFPAFNTVAILYIVLTLAASSLIKWLEKRTNAKDR